ncbi:hypothetical protein H8D79_00070 [PVC group bacterium]|nr:hypothetical protein [PVC group bacterium]
MELSLLDRYRMYAYALAYAKSGDFIAAREVVAKIVDRRGAELWHANDAKWFVVQSLQQEVDSILASRLPSATEDDEGEGDPGQHSIYRSSKLGKHKRHQEVLDSLDERERAVAVLRLAQKLPVVEIAGMLNLDEREVGEALVSIAEKAEPGEPPAPCPDGDSVVLALLASDAAPYKDREGVEAHVTQCPECKASLETVRESLTGLSARLQYRALPPLPPEELLRKPEPTTHIPPQQAKPAPPGMSLLRLMLAAALPFMILCVVLTGLRFGSGGYGFGSGRYGFGPLAVMAATFGGGITSTGAMLFTLWFMTRQLRRRGALTTRLRTVTTTMMTVGIVAWFLSVGVPVLSAVMRATRGPFWSLLYIVHNLWRAAVFPMVVYLIVRLVAHVEQQGKQ